MNQQPDDDTPKMSDSDSVATPLNRTTDSKMTINEEIKPESISKNEASTSDKDGKLCKSTWLGTQCQLSDCDKVHIKPCQDRECRALYDGLPLYKSHKCQFWHVQTKSTKKKPNEQGKPKQLGKIPNVSRKPQLKPSGKVSPQNRYSAKYDKYKANNRPVKQQQFQSKSYDQDFPKPKWSINTELPPGTLTQDPCFVPQNKWSAPSLSIRPLGNEPAAAATPLNRSGNPNFHWGQNQGNQV